MSEKRFTWVKHTYDSLGTIIDNETGKDLMGTKETCKFMNKREERIRELEDENEQLKQFKELLCAVLKQEYEDRSNEMNRWVEKEDWNGYRATKLEDLLREYEQYRGTMKAIDDYCKKHNGDNND